MEQKFRSTQKLRTLISENPMILMAMSRFGISLGFGDKTVETICKEQDVDCNTFLSVVNLVTFGTVDIHHLSIQSLISYLDHAHTYFLEFCLPRIRRKLIEALDCSGDNSVSLIILKFYDSYTAEVRRHMDYENDHVFAYVRELMKGHTSAEFNIDKFASNHHNISEKLNELKEIIVKYLPHRDNNLLNTVLFDIINCEQDLMAHCQVEDKIFIPVVRELELKNANIHANDNGETRTEEKEEYNVEISPRERDIIACVAAGLTNKEIADKLFISVNTVTTHRRNIAQKLEIHTPAGLAIYAVLNGIVDIKDLK